MVEAKKELTPEEQTKKEREGKHPFYFPAMKGRTERTIWATDKEAADKELSNQVDSEKSAREGEQ